MTADRTVGSVPETDPRQLRWVAAASAVGTTIEWYDYFIYSTAAALIFGSQFFSTLSPASGTLAAFATLGVGFLARPLGGVLWGHWGDRVGRKGMLIASLLLMGLATVGVGLLPTYSQIGVWAPILLLLLRLLQGLSAGGEWGGAALMAVEHAPLGKRGRYGAAAQIGVPGGLILAQLMFFLISNTVSGPQFAAWGWRVPFLVSIVLVGMGLWVRLKVEESPVFRTLRDEQARSKVPVVDVFRERGKELFLASVSFIANTAIGYVFLAYLLSYGTAVLKLSRNLLLVVVIVGSVVWLVSIVASAILSDHTGRKPVYLVGSVLLVVWAVPFFLLFDTKEPLWLLVGVIVLCVGLGLTFGPQPALFAGMFEPRYRYSGASISYAVGAVVGGGFAPLIATALQSATGTSLSVSLYMIVVGLISLAAVLAIREPQATA
ncbi:MAG TPA: MFS transporter [Pseudonocardia sp.]|jgi:metabolite-proton symporter|nr:MFS transporter [Pseudonocardia sp.]